MGEVRLRGLGRIEEPARAVKFKDGGFVGPAVDLAQARKDRQAPERRQYRRHPVGTVGGGVLGVFHDPAVLFPREPDFGKGRFPIGLFRAEDRHLPGFVRVGEPGTERLARSLFGPVGGGRGLVFQPENESGERGDAERERF